MSALSDLLYTESHVALGADNYRLVLQGHNEGVNAVREALLAELDRLRDAQELPSVRIGWNGALDAVRRWAGGDQ